MISHLMSASVLNKPLVSAKDSQVAKLLTEKFTLKVLNVRKVASPCLFPFMAGVLP